MFNELQKLSYNDLLKMYRSLGHTGLVNVHLSHVGYMFPTWELVAWAHTKQGYHTLSISTMRNVTGELVDPIKVKAYREEQMANS